MIFNFTSNFSEWEIRVGQFAGIELRDDEEEEKNRVNKFGIIIPGKFFLTRPIKFVSPKSENRLLTCPPKTSRVAMKSAGVACENLWRRASWRKFRPLVYIRFRPGFNQLWTTGNKQRRFLIRILS